MWLNQTQTKICMISGKEISLTKIEFIDRINRTTE